MSIAGAFDRAADYDRHASIQARVARRLADRIAAEPLPSPPNILEIGCGTGLLGAELVDRFADARWLMTDIAPGMVARTAARFAGDPRVEVAVMDGEQVGGEANFDLICSSLALQWFRDLPSGVRRLRSRLTPNGLLAFTTLAAGSFAEWGAAHEDHASGIHDYPTQAGLEAMGLGVAIARYPVRHADAYGFLRSLKAIGAATPRPGHRPLSPAALRRVMARFEAAGATATYVVATCIVRGAQA
jgi:malonyl-CoA O-methyltransferase